MNTLIFDLDDTLLWDKKSVEESIRAAAMESTAYGADAKTLVQSVRKWAPKLYAELESYTFTQDIGINPFEGLWGSFGDIHDHRFRLMGTLIKDYQTAVWKGALNDQDIQNEDLAGHLAERFVFHRRHLPYVYADTFEVLEELSSRYQLVLLTNGAPSLQHIKLQMTPQLVPYFSHIIISGAFGKGKPDDSIFQYALTLSGIEKENALMIGDNLYTDILGSNRTGISNIWINRENKPADSEVPATMQTADLWETVHAADTFFKNK